MNEEKSFRERDYETVDPDLLDQLNHDNNWLQELLRKMHGKDSGAKAISPAPIRIKPQMQVDMYKERIVLPRLRESPILRDSSKLLKRNSSEAKKQLRRRSPPQSKEDAIFEMYGVERRKHQLHEKKKQPTAASPTPKQSLASLSRTSANHSVAEQMNIEEYYRKLFQKMTSNAAVDEVNQLEQSVKLLKAKYGHLRHFDASYYRQANSLCIKGI